jgi:folate-dependent phosphoribosylglycinamide formyltransferase PurN
VLINDIEDFYKKKGLDTKKSIKITDMDVRKEFDSITAENLRAIEKEHLKGQPIGIIAYSGYMHLVTSPLLDYNKGYTLGISIHPTDPEICSENGAIKYLGKDALKRFIIDYATRPEDNHANRYMRSMTHLVDRSVNSGRILMVSRPVEIILGKEFDITKPESVSRMIYSNADRLKANGEREIFIKTIEDCILRRFLIYSDGQTYYSQTPDIPESFVHIPKGLRLENNVPTESKRFH